MTRVTKEVKDLLDAQNATINLLKSQLQAKTDECEELKSTIGYYITKTGQILADTDAMTDQFHKIEQENTALKQELGVLSEFLNDMKDLYFIPKQR